MDDSRARRDELLLDLGALVFELHRQGRRAPDLLTAKAADLDAIDARVRPGEPEKGPCVHCGAEAELEQLVCLRCGGRIALGAEATAEAGLGEPSPEAAPAEAARPRAGAARRRWPRALAPLAVAAAVAAVTLALLQLLDGGGKGAAERARHSVRLAPPAPAERAARRARAPARPGPERWTGGRAYTVVLLTAGDAASARRGAGRLAGQEVRAGVVRHGGYWLVFSGRYDDQARAAAAATRLRGRLGAAYVQLIER
jgi:pyruvate/2-oxoglutarate dehydrogenase complex dihydrolipoamide acyltransferase (E2) component